MVSYDNTPQLHQSRAVQLVSGQVRLTAQPPRVCTSEDCRTKLSRYNPSDTCTVHEGWKDTRIRHHA